MLQNVRNDFPYPFRRSQRRLPVNRLHLFVSPVLHMHRVHIVDPEGKDIFIIDGIHDRVGMQRHPGLTVLRIDRTAEELRCRGQLGICTFICIICKYRRPCKPEQIVFLEELRDFMVHFPELAAVTFIKYDDHPLVRDLMAFVL